MTAALFGGRWQPEAAPGIYEDIHRVSARENVRLDVPCFIGLAERGPLNTPVPVENLDQFALIFGRAVEELRFPAAVRLFFQNGGRKCVVIRCLNHQEARTTCLPLPGMELVGNGTKESTILLARNPGAWGNYLKLTARLRRRPVSLLLVSTREQDPASDAELSWSYMVRDQNVHVGDTFFFSLPDGADRPHLRYNDNKKDQKCKPFFAYVSEIAKQPSSVQLDHEYPVFRTGDDEPTGTVDSSTSFLAWKVALSPSCPSPPSPAEGDVFRHFQALLAQAQILTVDLVVELHDERVESWQDAALHFSHPLYLPRLIGRRSASEELRPPKGGEKDVESPLYEADRLWGEISDPWGSEFIRPDNTLAPVPGGELDSLATQAHLPWLIPTIEMLQSPVGVSIDAQDLLCHNAGNDASQWFDRSHFFNQTESPPGLKGLPRNHAKSVFSERPGPLDPNGGVLMWDQAHPYEPIAMVSLPDLCHPIPPLTTLEVLPMPSPRCFSPEMSAAIDPLPNIKDGSYDFIKLRIDPELTAHLADFTAGLNNQTVTDSQSNSPADVLGWQRQVVQACQRLGSCVAMLDVPPGLDGTTLHLWRSLVASDRSVLYAPWLMVDVDGTAMAVPPSPVACGIAARLERERGVWAAPANAVVQGSFATAYGAYLPASAVLHNERIDEIRTSPLGLLLFGSRTTSFDNDWTHLSVRRLMDWIRLQLIQDLAWTPFEPNGPLLWTAMVGSARRRLLELLHAGALAGRNDSESFFIRCDAETNTPLDQELGRVVMLVGVAPAVPAEFLVFTLVRHDVERPGVEAI